jgi:hypothetical protein
MQAYRCKELLEGCGEVVDATCMGSREEVGRLKKAETRSRESKKTISFALALHLLASSNAPSPPKKKKRKTQVRK